MSKPTLSEVLATYDLLEGKQAIAERASDTPAKEQDDEQAE